MRTLLLAGAALALLAGSTAGVVHAADIYEPAPAYGAAPPVYPPPPPAYRPAPRYGYAPPAYGVQPGYAPPPPQAYGPPPAVAYDDDEEEVVVAPPPVYRDGPVYAQRPRYEHCWWEWGERLCAPRRGW